MRHNYDKLQPFLGPKNLQLLYLDCISFASVLELKLQLMTEKILNIYLTPALLMKIMSYSVIKKNVFGKCKIETPKNI